MCAIFGSKDKQKFLELAELNQYRGNHSWSTTCFVTGRFEHYANAERVKHILTFRGEGEFKDKVDSLIEDRSNAKQKRDFELADKIRSELIELGVEINDSPEGTTWKVVK